MEILKINLKINKKNNKNSKNKWLIFIRVRINEEVQVHSPEFGP